MKKSIFLFLGFFLLLTGCSQPASQKEGTVFTDDLDRQVTVQTPQRVACLTGSFADVWLSAGGQDTLVAAPHDAWTTLELDLPEDTVDLGGIKDPNAEQILALEPDLVIASAKNESQKKLISLLEDNGIPALYFDISSFDDYLAMLEICTQLTGQPEKYIQNGTDLQQEIDTAKAMADGSKPTVLYLRSAGSHVKALNSQGSVLGEMLADLDTINIADDESLNLNTLSLEAIAQADPDYIFLVVQGSTDSTAQDNLEQMVLSHPIWQQLSAVKEGRVYTMDQRLYNLKPNSQWGQAYLQLAEILYGSPAD